MLQIMDKDDKQGAVVSLDRSDITSKPIDIRIDDPKAMTVVVNGPDGKPLEGLSIGLTQYWAGHSKGLGSLKTNALGEAAFDGLWTGGAYALSMEIKDLTAPSPSIRVDAPGWTGRIQINLEPGTRSQAGIVVNTEGKPVAEATVYSKTFRYCHAKTDSKGRFVLTGLPNAPVEISAYTTHTQGHGSGRATAGPDTQELVITLDKCE